MWGSRPWAIFACCMLLLAACEDRVPFFGPIAPYRQPAAEANAQKGDTPPADISLGGEAAEKPKPIIVDGIDRTAQAASVPGVAVRELDGDRVTLNFVNASLPEVTQAILGGILHVNYFIDPQVTGDVTIETTDPIPRDALLATFETVLKVNGAALIKGEDFYKVVPIDQAPRSAPPILASRGDRPGLPGFRIQVVPLTNVSVADMQALLEPVAPPDGILRADAARNILILAGSRPDMKAMMDVIDIFDVDWLRDKSFGIFPVEYADSATMVGELQHVLGSELGVDLTSVLRYVSIDRLNAVLVISPNKDYVELVGEWIARLDRSWDQNDQRIFVYPVQNGKAANLASIINDLFGGSSTGSRTAARTETVAPRLERTQIGTPQAAASSTTGTQTASATSATAKPATPTAAASGAAKSGTDIAGQGGGGTGGGGTGGGTAPASGFSDLRVIADETNNSLVILATPAQYRTIETTLRRLDIVPLQVLIEATIAEITLNDDLRYGVQWFFETGRTHQFNLSTIADSATPALSSSGFSYLLNLGSGNIKTALDLLSDVSDVKVISSPHLMVLGNQSASLQVGDQVPVLTRTSTSTTNADAPIVTEVEYRDTGIILTVTPRVNPGGLVTLEIEQEASSVVETTTGATDSPTIQQRRISSTVAVQSGESIALGGLIRDGVTKSRSGIPILYDIPILGSLFGRTNDLQDRNELIVILTPRVVSNASEAAKVSQELRTRMRGLEKWNRLPF